MDKTVVMKATDNVATCLANMRAGEEAVVEVDANTHSVTLKGDIPFGHKVALMDIAVGSKITKYAETIGIASQPIAAGEHVHVHNVESARARGDKS